MLHAAAQVIDGGEAEAGDVEGVQHPHRFGKACGKRGGVAAERIDRGVLDPVSRADTQSHKAFPLRPSITSSSRATGPLRSTTPVAKAVECRVTRFSSRAG